MKFIASLLDLKTVINLNTDKHYIMPHLHYISYDNKIATIENL